MENTYAYQQAKLEALLDQHDRQKLSLERTKQRMKRRRKLKRKFQSHQPIPTHPQPRPDTKAQPQQQEQQQPQQLRLQTQPQPQPQSLQPSLPRTLQQLQPKQPKILPQDANEARQEPKSQLDRLTETNPRPTQLQITQFTHTVMNEVLQVQATPSTPVQSNELNELVQKWYLDTKAALEEGWFTENEQLVKIKTIENNSSHGLVGSRTVYARQDVPEGSELRTAVVPKFIYPQYEQLQEVVFKVSPLQSYAFTLDTYELPRYLKQTTKDLYIKIIKTKVKTTRHYSNLYHTFYPDPFVTLNSSVCFVNSCSRDKSRSRVHYTSEGSCVNTEFSGIDLVFFRGVPAGQEVVAYYGGWNAYELKKHCVICPKSSKTLEKTTTNLLYPTTASLGLITVSQVLSIGTTCFTKRLLIDTGLCAPKTALGPFDRIRSSITMVQNCIDTNFEHLNDRNNFKRTHETKNQSTNSYYAQEVYNFSVGHTAPRSSKDTFVTCPHHDYSDLTQHSNLLSRVEFASNFINSTTKLGKLFLLTMTNYKVPLDEPSYIQLQQLHTTLTARAPKGEVVYTCVVYHIHDCDKLTPECTVSTHDRLYVMKVTCSSRSNGLILSGSRDQSFVIERLKKLFRTG